MTTQEKIAQALFEAIDEINQQLSDRRHLAKSLDTPLFGKGGGLDSLGLVNLIVAAEERIQEAFDTTISLADERAMSQTSSPFKTVGSLADYIAQLMKGGSDE